ncbi:MAG TPA: hypothetical protein VF179_06850 [Thermoanaerobaculia bacterium]|nr:hypothetical protein [Thermoanaerobaculia bacterium]
MKAVEESLEKYLVRSILIVDSDQASVGQLAGILATLKGEPNSGEIIAASVSSLAETLVYIEEKSPYIVIIDPQVDSFVNTVSFLEAMRQSHSHITWVINTRDHWWSEHEQALSSHVFGGRLRDYYTLTKNRPYNQLRIDFLNVLSNCQCDLILTLFGETTEDLQSQAFGRMTKRQVAKFTGKAFNALRSLNKASIAKPGRGDIAFVSMRYTDPQRDLYTLVIEPVLKGEGLVPILIEREFPSHRSIPQEITDKIEQCSIFVADITGLRPDVMMEVGAAQILQKTCIFLADERELPLNEIPFMLKPIRIEFYSSEKELMKKLKAAVVALKNRR